MKMRNRGMIGLALTTILALSTPGWTQENVRPELILTRCATPPVVDGELADAAWEKAAPITDFHVLGSTSAAGDTISARAVRDDEWLYLAFTIQLPHPEAITTRAADHDGPIAMDDSIDLLFDPGTDGQLYLHYMLSVANVRGERRVTNYGASKDKSWNVPWRSGTTITKTGWQAELAIPLSVLAEEGPLDKLTLNMGVTRVLLTLGLMNAPVASRRENASWAPVKRSFNETARFGSVKGLTNFKPKLPLLVSAGNVQTTPYRKDEQAGFVYEVSGTVNSFNARTGTVRVMAEDRPELGQPTTITQTIAIEQAGTTPFSLLVPVATPSARRAELSLCNPVTGEKLQTVPLRDISDMRLLRAYARLSYYTTEPDAGIVCEIGLPAESLNDCRLTATDAHGSRLAESTHVTPQALLAVPLSTLATGTHTITVTLLFPDGKAAITQQVELVKRAPNPGCEWKIDRRDKVILNNGKPFFPFGVMSITLSTNINDQSARDLAEMGFNAVVRWGRTPLDKIEDALDLGQKYGFKIIDFPAYWSYTPVPGDEPPQTPPNTHWQEAAAMQTDWRVDRIYLPGVKRIMHHPSLMAYYLWDEPQDHLGTAAAIDRYNRRLNETDGYHPTEVLYIPPVPEGAAFSDNCDILGVDPYWVPGAGSKGDLGNPNRVGYQTWLARRRADRDLKLAWITPCAERWSGTRMRFITENEQRVQTYLSLIHGAGALLYFVHPFQHQATRDTFKRLGVEMKTLGPACATPEVAQTVRYSPTPFDPVNNVFPDVQVALKRNPAGNAILLAANWRPYPVDMTACLSGAGGIGTIRSLFGRALPLESTDGIVTDTIEAMGTRAYTVETRSDEPVLIDVALTAIPDKTDLFFTKLALPDSGEPGKKNILRNSSFEECSLPGMADYYHDMRTRYAGVYGSRAIGDTRGDAGAGVVTNQPFDGQRCLRLQAEKGVNSFLLFNVAPNVQKPTPFVFSAWVRGDGNPGATVEFYRPVGKSLVPTSDWQRMSVTGTVSQATLIGFTVQSTATNDVWIDAMQFELGTTLTPYEP